MIRHPLSFASGALVGLGIMYFFDSQNGARRRARVVEAVRARESDAIDQLQAARDELAESARDIAAAAEEAGVRSA